MRDAVGTAADPDELLRSVYDAYGSMLLRYVISLPYDAHLAHDVVQETLVRAWKHPEILEKPAPVVRAWLCRVAHNIAIDDLRSARHRRELSVDPPERDDAGESWERHFDRWLITDALASLSPEHRDVVIGAHFGGKSIGDLARELGIPLGTVKSRMHYGMRALRLALQERRVTS